LKKVSEARVHVLCRSQGWLSTPSLYLAMNPAPWPWGDGLWEVPRWAFALLVALVVLPALWLLGRRAIQSFKDRG
jgi:hypothetical protein